MMLFLISPLPDWLEDILPLARTKPARPVGARWWRMTQNLFRRRSNAWSPNSERSLPRVRGWSRPSERTWNISDTGNDIVVPEADKLFVRILRGTSDRTIRFEGMWRCSAALHVLVAVEAESQRCLVVTAYVPDPALWREDFKTRRTP